MNNDNEAKEVLSTIKEEQNCCKDCCREITKEEAQKYRGFCKNCYEERYNRKETTNTPNSGAYHTVTVIYAVILFIVSIVAGINTTYSYEDFNVTVFLSVLLFDFITTFLFFMLSTIIEELRILNSKK